jgi:uracil-DNA glycosylase
VTEGGNDLTALEAEIHACRKCPRLVRWREQVACEKRAAFREWEYWGRPVGGFGDPHARIVVLGLAPAAHGANRTGRVFTGDRSGDFLYASLWRCGMANQPESIAIDDGLRLRGCWVTAAVRCAPPANKPTTAERDRCAPFLARELALLADVRVIVCLGGFAWDAALRFFGAPRPKPAFTHGAELVVDAGTGLRAGTRDVTLLGSYHVSQQNTFTGRLTEAMLDAVFERAQALADV